MLPSAEKFRQGVWARANATGTEIFRNLPRAAPLASPRHTQTTSVTRYAPPGLNSGSGSTANQGSQPHARCLRACASGGKWSGARRISKNFGACGASRGYSNFSLNFATLLASPNGWRHDAATRERERSAVLCRPIIQTVLIQI